MSVLVVGVDGGGSRTRAIVATAAGETVATAEGGPSAVRPGEASASAQVIADVVREALAGLEPAGGSARVLCAGVAGAGRDAERDALWQALQDAGVADEVIVQADASIALEDAFGGGPGLLLIAGTGSVAYGVGPTGAFARCGGWGPTCGDEGSGAWIGRRALSVVTASHDGREPETALTGAVLTATELQEVADLVAWGASATPAMLATLAPVVLQAAQAGDLRATSLVSLAVEELVLHVRALARHLFRDERHEVPLALGGGLLDKGSLLRRRLVQRLKSGVPGARVRDDEVIPARGAIRIAMRHMGALAG